MTLVEHIIGDAVVLRVMFEDTDCTGRVHFSKYAVWLDNGIVHYLRRRRLKHLEDGSIIDEDRGERVAFAIGEYYVRMDRPSKLGDLIRVESRPSEIRRRVVVFEGELRSYPSEALLARGRVTLVHIDPSTSRSRDMPEWLVEKIRARSV